MHGLCLSVGTGLHCDDLSRFWVVYALLWSDVVSYEVQLSNDVVFFVFVIYIAMVEVSIGLFGR